LAGVKLALLTKYGEEEKFTVRAGGPPMDHLLREVELKNGFSPDRGSGKARHSGEEGVQDRSYGYR